MTATRRSGPVAILGATSRIASDLVAGGGDQGYALYARDPARVAAFLRDRGLPAEWQRGTLDDFARDAAGGAPFCGVVNFVGVGDPAKAQAMGAAIFDATAASDRRALEALVDRPGTPYVFMSSGAVYGTGFAAPADGDTATMVPVNALRPTDWYTIAKLHAEAVHRSCAGLTIIDLRIFNYVSRHLDPEARFLVTDMVRAVRDDTVFETADTDMWRDFLHPAGFRDLLAACLAAPPGTNRPVDAYSAAAISKRALVTLMADEFGMRHRFADPTDVVNATGSKPCYYSTFGAAAELGYRPRFSSADAVREEVAAMLARK